MAVLARIPDQQSVPVLWLIDAEQLARLDGVDRVLNGAGGRPELGAEVGRHPERLERRIAGRPGVLVAAPHMVVGAGAVLGAQAAAGCGTSGSASADGGRTGGRSQEDVVARASSSADRPSD